MLDKQFLLFKSNYPPGVVEIYMVRNAAFVLYYRVRGMTLLENLPLELQLKIGYELKSWEEIHNFTSVVRILRKCEDYAKYARGCYERERARFDEMEENIAAEIDSQLGEQLVGSDLQR